MQLFFVRIFSSRTAPYIFLVGLIGIQLIVGFQHIQDPFIDGRFHQNWNPPFWLLNAEATNEVGFTKAYVGVVNGFTRGDDGSIAGIQYYASHPQLIGPVFALWTRVFGYAEWSPRLLALLLITGAMIIFFRAFWILRGLRFAVAFASLFITLPLIVIYGTMLNHEPLVLFFLALSFLGFTKMIHGGRGGLTLFAIGIVGMALSDWSGLVFGGLCALLFLLPPLRKIQSARRIFFVGMSALAAGLIIFFIQSYMQSGLSLHEFMVRYMDLWRYRSGQENQILWRLWFLKQLVFLNRNYSLILFLAGMAGIGSALVSFRTHHFKLQDKNFKSSHSSTCEIIAATFFMAALVAGQFFYLIFVKQATFVHL